MAEGCTVRPEKWSEVLDLYDDGDYSAIWGCYDRNEKRCLGVRWNGVESALGYPNQGGNPLWYVEVDFLTRPILHRLLDRILAPNQNKKPIIEKREKYIKNILTALQECD